MANEICEICKEKKIIGPKIIGATKRVENRREVDYLVTRIMCDDCYEKSKKIIVEEEEK